jgi:hypothetical protein
MSAIRLNATSIGDFKACPTRFRLKHIEHLAPVEDADSLRMGTNWHKLHEVYTETLQYNREQQTSEELAQDNAISSIILHLNKAYENMPASKTVEEWGVEREILLRSFLVYLAYWQNNPLQVVATEQKFELPLLHPRVGMPMNPKLAVLTGRMDQIVMHNGRVCVLERKSTSQDIAEGAEYWHLLRKNEQVSIYALALRKMVRTSEGWVDGYDFPSGYVAATQINGVMPKLGNTLYDVWRKPQIEPKKLTQEASAQFVADGAYFGEKFENYQPAELEFTVNGERVVAEAGKKPGTFAIRETIAMYGARLQATMAEDPARYFQRQEIARTDAEIAEFEKELFAVYTAMSIFEREQCYFSNPHACKSPYPCSFIAVCYGAGADSVKARGEPPPGYKFTHLTVGGK